MCCIHLVVKRVDFRLKITSLCVHFVLCRAVGFDGRPALPEVAAKMSRVSQCYMYAATLLREIPRSSCRFYHCLITKDSIDIRNIQGERGAAPATPFVR